MKKKSIIATSATLVALASVVLTACGNKGTKVEVPESTPETKASFEKAIKDQAIAQSTETEEKVTDYYTNGIKVEVEKKEDIATVYVPTEKYVRDKEGYTKVSDIQADEKIVVDKGVIKGVVKVSAVKPEETKATESQAPTTTTETTTEAKPTESQTSETKPTDIKPIKKYEEKEIKYNESKHTKKEYEEISKRDVSKAKTDTDESIKKALEAESKNKDIPKVVEKTTESQSSETTQASEAKQEQPKENAQNTPVSGPETQAAPAQDTNNNTPSPTPQPQPSPQPNNPTPAPEPQPQPQPTPAPTEQRRNWQPVYRTVHHDAITHTKPKYISSDRKLTTYSYDEMEAYIDQKIEEDVFVSYTVIDETTVDKPAWDEQVLDHYVDTYTGETKPV